MSIALANITQLCESLEPALISSCFARKIKNLMQLSIETCASILVKLFKLQFLQVQTFNYAFNQLNTLL